MRWLVEALGAFGRALGHAGKMIMLAALRKGG